jgi:hypothetical protein
LEFFVFSSSFFLLFSSIALIVVVGFGREGLGQEEEDHLH